MIGAYFAHFWEEILQQQGKAETQNEGDCKHTLRLDELRGYTFGSYMHTFSMS